jgi:parvulin-like peptidyl-prolyl isomerase
MTLEEYLKTRRLRLLTQNLARKGLKQIEDEKDRKKVFDENPDYYDGSMVSLMHIQIATLPWFTPEQFKEKRLEAEEIRRDLVEGKRTWEECVQKSDDYATRPKNGLIGPTQRYQIDEEIVGPAWDLEIGEISEVLQSPRGYHIVKVTARHPGNRTFEDPKVKVAMEGRFQEVYARDVLAEARKKWPVVGVARPDMTGLWPQSPTPAETQPAGAATRPAAGRANRR